ncbi:MAG: 3-deoxy-7-phosphoheptulonate synthase [Pyrinomonadaceae bacterium]
MANCQEQEVFKIMLIVMKHDALPEDSDRVIKIIEKLGFQANLIPGANRTAIGITGNPGPVDATAFENLRGVAETIKVTKPYKLASLDFNPSKLVVRVGEARIGGDELTIIAGVCSVETREQAFTVAEAVKKSGAQMFRGGAFKPRTNPYAFQGLGEEGLQIMAEIRERWGLPIVTEAMDERGADLVEKYADCIQIGARNMQNFSLLKRVGRSSLPVLLKRGMSATLEDLLSASEYILAEGNKNVILCERGIRTFANHSRNTLDLSIVPAAQKLTHLPIIVDPSHGAGKTFMVAPLARAAVAVGADGIIVEMHPEPAKALSDSSQALTPAQYLEMVEQLKVLHDVMQAVLTFRGNNEQRQFAAETCPRRARRAGERLALY